MGKEKRSSSPPQREVSITETSGLSSPRSLSGFLLPLCLGEKSEFCYTKDFLEGRKYKSCYTTHTQVPRANLFFHVLHNYYFSKRKKCIVLTMFIRRECSCINVNVWVNLN